MLRPPSGVSMIGTTLPTPAWRGFSSEMTNCVLAGCIPITTVSGFSRNVSETM